MWHGRKRAAIDSDFGIDAAPGCGAASRIVE